MDICRYNLINAPGKDCSFSFCLILTIMFTSKLSRSIKKGREALAKHSPPSASPQNKYETECNNKPRD